MGSGIPDTPMNPLMQEARDLVIKLAKIKPEVLEHFVIIGYTEMQTYVVGSGDPETMVAVMITAIGHTADPTWVIHTDLEGNERIVVAPKEAN